MTQAHFDVDGLNQHLLRLVLCCVTVLSNETALCEGSSGLSGLCVVLQCRRFPWERL